MGTAPTELISIGEAARISGLSIETLRRYDAAGHITALRTPGGQRRFVRAEIEELFTAPLAKEVQTA